MGKIRKPDIVKLIAGIIYSDESVKNIAYKKLKNHFGEIDSISDPVIFNFTDYYSKEMGDHLIREFIGFKLLMDNNFLPGTKIITNKIEESLADPETGNRRINIDPGYIEPGKLILASTKNYSHRIHLSDGIYADLSYRYIKGTFRPLEWTYPDYRVEKTINMFNAWRKSYMTSLLDHI